MKRIITATLLALATACGAPEDIEWIDTTDYAVPNIYVPGQEGRVDLTVWHDGAFNTPEAKKAFCAEHGDMPEAWFCSELGTARQGWEVAEYHGMASGAGETCYGPAATAGTGDCVVPRTTWMKVVSSYGGCFAGAAPPNGPSLTQETAILEGIKDGMYTWHGMGAGYGHGVAARVEPKSGSVPSNYMPVTISCGVAGGYAVGGLSGSPVNYTSNAPVGPNSGKDQDDIYTAPNGIMTVDIVEIWQAAGAACGGGANVSAANLRIFARSIGAHEQGHVLGFSHFDNNDNLNNNVMAPWRNPNLCNSASPILEAYQRALGFIAGPGGGANTVTDRNLWAELPL
jgi:hypothetical protein